MTRKWACAAVAFAFLPVAGQAQTNRCDVDGDGQVSLTDVMLVVNEILGNNSDSKRSIQFYVNEEPFYTESGETMKSVRRAPEVTTSTLNQFYIHTMYYDKGYDYIELSDGSLAYLITEKGYYQNEATWPSNAGMDGLVSVFAYLNYKIDSEPSCYKDENNRPYLKVELEENSSEQIDVLVAKEEKSWNDCKVLCDDGINYKGVIKLTFHHACAAAQFSIKKSAEMQRRGYNIDVNQVVLHNIIKTGDYMLDNFSWKIPEASENTVTNFTLDDYENGPVATSFSLSTEETLLAKDENDFLFLLPTEIKKAEGDFSSASLDKSYIEIKCKIYDNYGNYKVGEAGTGDETFKSVYLPFGFDFSGYKGKIKKFVINVGTKIRKYDGTSFDL